MKKLTPQRERFCQEFLVDLNGSAAAVRAKYSARSAKEQACELLKEPAVAARVQELMDERAVRLEIKVDEVITRLDVIGDLDIGECFDERGKFKPIQEIPAHVRRCIKSIKVFEEFEGFGKDRVQVGEVREITFWDKIKANELIGKHRKLFTDKIEHSGLLTLEDFVAGSREGEDK